MALVLFKRGTSAEYTALTSKADNAFYYTTDDKKLYLGDVPLAGGGVVVENAAVATGGYAKTYIVKQDGREVGKIDIPKDMVISSGTIKNYTTDQAAQTATGDNAATAGKYIELTIANATADKIYISVKDLVDTYTAAQGATKIQLAISASNEISASIVASSITATELADNAVETAKIKDDAIETAKVKDKAITKAKLEQTVQDAIDAITWGTITV